VRKPGSAFLCVLLYATESLFMSSKIEQPKTLAEYRRSHDALVRNLTSVGFIWPGTLQFRTLTCGKQRCACLTDRNARHGPYFFWTTKKKGKTVSRKISCEEAQILGDWIQNRRTIEKALQQMIQISEQVLLVSSHGKRATRSQGHAAAISD
jgi:hypothetical protein